MKRWDWDGSGRCDLLSPRGTRRQSRALKRQWRALGCLTPVPAGHRCMHIIRMHIIRMHIIRMHTIRMRHGWAGGSLIAGAEAAACGSGNGGTG